MPTYQEIEDIKKAQVREILRVQEKVLANLSPGEPRLGGATLLASPFARADRQSPAPYQAGGAHGYQQAGTQIAVAPDANAVNGEGGLLVTGIVSVAGLVLLGVMLRRMLE